MCLAYGIYTSLEYYHVSILFHGYGNYGLYDIDITIHNYSKCLAFNGVLSYILNA